MLNYTPANFKSFFVTALVEE